MGACQAWKGLRGAAVQRTPSMDDFRACIRGLVLVGIGAVWVWHLPVLLARGEQADVTGWAAPPGCLCPGGGRYGG